MMMSIENINMLINKDNIQWSHLYDYKEGEQTNLFEKNNWESIILEAIQVEVHQQQITTKKKFNSRTFRSLNCHVICCNSSDYFTLL